MAQENLAAITPAHAKQPQFEVIIEGKIDSIEQPNESEWQYFTIRARADDEYSAPQLVQVSQPASQRPFARKDDIIRIRAHLGGYARRYNGNRYVTNTLTFVERL